MGWGEADARDGRLIGYSLEVAPLVEQASLFGRPRTVGGCGAVPDAQLRRVERAVRAAVPTVVEVELA